MAQNIRGNIKRNLYIYDKETYKCFEESLEGTDDDYFTSDSTMEKMPKTLAEEFKDKILGLEEDLDEDIDLDEATYFIEDVQNIAINN